MCSSYTPPKPQQLHDYFGVDCMTPEIRPEIYPGYLAPLIRLAQDGSVAVECVPACFGLVPHWAELKLARHTYNARSETVASKPSFRHSRAATVERAWSDARVCARAPHAPRTPPPATKPCSPPRVRVCDAAPATRSWRTAPRVRWTSSRSPQSPSSRGGDGGAERHARVILIISPDWAAVLVTASESITFSAPSSFAAN